MIFVGIDVAKSKHDCCIIDSNGSILSDSLQIANSREGFESLYSAILSFLPNEDLMNVKIGLESTGHYSTNITNYLSSKGFQVTILNPLVTNLFRKAHTLRKTKTDKTDAKVIATMLFTDDSKSYSPVSYQIQELKSLTRHRYRMVGYRSKLRTSIARLIDILFPELPTFAAIILAEIGDIERFSTPAKLLAFAGMEPSTYQSGKYNASNTPMVKRGSTYLSGPLCRLQG